jgi:hypothetical protein
MRALISASGTRRAGLRKGQVVEDAQMRIERILLEDESDIARRGLETQRLAAIDPHFAFIRPLEPGDDAQGGRLAGPGRAQEHGEFTIGDIEREALDGRDRLEALRHMAQRDVSHDRHLRTRSPGFPFSRLREKVAEGRMRVALRCDDCPSRSVHAAPTPSPARWAHRSRSGQIGTI